MSDLDFNAAGFFTGNELHPRDVTLGGESHTIHVRKMPAVEMRRWGEELRSEELETRIDAGFRVLQKAIRREDGRAAMTLDQARTLKVEALRELMRVFVDVNRLPDAEEAGNA